MHQRPDRPHAVHMLEGFQVIEEAGVVVKRGDGEDAAFAAFGVDQLVDAEADRFHKFPAVDGPERVVAGDGVRENGGRSTREASVRSGEGITEMDCVRVRVVAR